MFMTALFYLWVLFVWSVGLRHCQNRVAPLVKRGKKVSRLQDFFLKGCFIFFFVKILKIKAGYTRMYPVYKNAYKRPFCPNKKALKGEKNEETINRVVLLMCFHTLYGGGCQ